MPLDYLVEGINSKLDKKKVKQLQDMKKLEARYKEHVFAMLDASLVKNRIQADLK
jgi:hypothetical protein